MTDVIERKVRIFISSRINDKFVIVRKAIKALLNETGLCETYAFDSDGSESS